MTNKQKTHNHHQSAINLHNFFATNAPVRLSAFLLLLLLLPSAERIFAYVSTTTSEQSVQFETLNPTELETNEIISIEEDVVWDEGILDVTTQEFKIVNEEVAVTEITRDTIEDNAATTASATDTYAYDETSFGVTDTIFPHDLGDVDFQNIQDEPVDITELVVNDLVITSSNDALVTFDRTRCIEVAGGNFYCQDSVSAEISSRPDGVYAYPDKDGDLEIYIQRNNVLTQITHNTVDDSSPYYDTVSNTIVWHRQINDRFQIISYDVTTQIETQITDSNTNNMEPARYGEYIAWQAWLDNNWEIVLFDGSTMKRLTHSPEHDVAPQLRNGLLLWSSHNRGGQQLVNIYNPATNEYLSIADSAGEIISNPRMVVLYESTNRSGDTTVKGYDIITGEIIPISNQPRPRPSEIPTPSPIEEPTAIIPANNEDDLMSDGMLDDEDLDTDSSLYELDEYTVLIDPGNQSIGPLDVAEGVQIEEGLILDLRPDPDPVDEDFDIIISPYVEIKVDSGSETQNPED